MRALWILLLVLISTAAVAVVRGDWQLDNDFNRSVELKQSIDLKGFMRENNIQDSEVRSQSDGSRNLSFNMPDIEWTAFAERACSGDGILSCGHNQCREFLDAEPLQARVSRQSGGPVPGGRVVLVPRAPDLSAWAAEDKPAAEPPLDAKLPGALNCDYGSLDALQGPVTAALDGSGQGSLGLPDNLDPGCWEVISGEGCSADARPLSALLPEREPDKVLVLFALSAANDPLAAEATANDLAQQSGTSLLDLTVLGEADLAIARFDVGGQALSPEELAAQLAADSRVEGAQPEYRYRTSATGKDPFAWMNYGSRETGVEQFQGITPGRQVQVAVIDTGVDTAHPELAQRVTVAEDFTGFGTAPDRHGTAVAGIIAAELGNGVGAYGVSPASSVLAYKACQPQSTRSLAARCWSSTLAKAFNAALASDAAVINMSLTGPQDPLLQRLVEIAAERGKLVVAAAGNDGRAAPAPFPASHPSVLAVTAVDASSTIYAQAIHGEFVDLAAPGVDLPAPSPGENYPAAVSGTSMAAAYVSGAAALLIAVSPDVSAESLRAMLEGGAVDLGPDNRDAAFGAGRVDLCGATRGLDSAPASCQD